MMNETVADIMSTELKTVAPADSLQRVKEILMAHRIHHVPVVDGKKLVGLVTTYDLFKLNIDHKDYDATKVSDVMTTKLAVIEPSDKIGTAAEIFMEHLFHAVPVVSEGNLVGIVTSFDILKYEYTKEYPPRA
ncbi:MAG: CBS domain-containing protein [Saprospiraceae bacterium]|nr:CBS domain-containing protein [Saprospiraceae bacterium]HMW39362.1 CBS domain-containing protein [Saprospiraceae bacterium]HMX88419.1 CBS domain-containing protein [Saprospiraceae bacterium]HMZ39061.1 CBS domain-containing protein [Saprospiraceae bacterium]HNA63401.1 CBS domain-containing protein [Saprospiraceae bacterium]